MLVEGPSSARHCGAHGAQPRSEKAGGVLMGRNENGAPWAERAAWRVHGGIRQESLRVPSPVTLPPRDPVSAHTAKLRLHQGAKSSRTVLRLVFVPSTQLGAWRNQTRVLI